MSRIVASLAVVIGFGVANGSASPEPLQTTQQVIGVLEEVDFIHRAGRFRDAATGDVADFAVLPSAAIYSQNAEADLRDLPLGTAYEFTLRQDADGRFTQVVGLRDHFTVDARQGVTYKVEAIDLNAGTLQVSRQGDSKGAGTRSNLRITDRTRISKGDKAARLADIAVGDDLLFNLAAGKPATCSNVWVGTEARKRATEEQRKKFTAFVKLRGLAGQVERTSGRTLTIALFGDPETFAAVWSKDFVADRDVHVVVTNAELRTWNPPVDHERAKMSEVAKYTATEPGYSGVRLTVTVNFMLEGFRKGRVVRVFGPGWRLLDQPFGEQLFHYGARSFPPELAENPAKEYPDQYPFRTDYSNAHLPWYPLKAGVVPPPDSEHRILGELLAVGADRKSGRFRPDDSREEVEFTMIPGGLVRSLNAEAGLEEVPVGTRCRFHLYQDGTGAFRKASFVTDEVSDLLKNGAAWRVESLNPTDGSVIAARQPAGVKNDQGDPEQPPDVGRAILRFGPDTRIWKGDKQVAFASLAIGDLLLINRSGHRPGRPSHCTEVWVGVETHKQFTNPRPKKTTPPSPKGTPR